MVLSRKASAIAPSMTLKIDALSKEMKANGLDVVGFGVGEPDFDTPDYIKKAAVEALERGFTKYTAASGINDLKLAICKRYAEKYGLAYNMANCVISNGAKHSLFNTFQAILNPGDEVILIAPYWLSYSELVKMADGVPVVVHASEENKFMPVVADLEAAVTDKTKAIIINSPSNPTGAVYSEELLREIAAFCEKHDLFIVSDEIYDELVYGIEPYSIASVSESVKERTIVINGLSKAYAMTGWRIGYVLCDAHIAKVMTSFQSNATSNPCSISQYAGVAALNGGTEEMAEMVDIFRSRRDLLCSMINDIPGLKCAVPDGAFYAFISIENFIGKSCNGQVITDDLSFAEILLKEKMVAVVPGTPFEAKNYIRLAYTCHEDRIKLGIHRLAEFCSELK